jgi:nucleotide-binding universal stress UspA family protein
VVHAWDLQGDDWMAARASLSKQQIESIRQEVYERHQVAFDTLLADYNTLGVNMQTHLIEGRAGMVIPEQARRQEAGLIVMGTVARTGLPGFIIGNTAENVLSQVGCSVLTVKPQGFETPVRLAS